MRDRVLTVCPHCGSASPVRLALGETCAACRARDAWSRAEVAGPLVIGRGDIDAAIRRREGDQVRSRTLYMAAWAPALGALALSAAGAVGARRLFAPQEVGPLAPLVDGLRQGAWTSMAFGFGAVAVAVAGLVWMRRRRTGRRLPLLAGHTVALVAGATLAVLGLLALSSLGGTGFESFAVPPFDPEVPRDEAVRRVMQATVVIVAPDEQGDARLPAIGTGTVIASEDDRAFVVTCSHVAMPYASASALRTPGDAWPVWVELSDGRGAKSNVLWFAPPPIDLAIVEVPIADAPAPVPIASDTSRLGEHARVQYVPLPLRQGWLVHRGEVLRREPHATSAGTFALVFTDLPVQPGDSGSALLDARGELVGLNTWNRSTESGTQGISLPSEVMREIVDALRRGTPVPALHADTGDEG